MVSMKEIRAVARRIGKQFHPDKVILFGSYAYGQPTEDSDVDLMVVMPFSGHPAYKSAEVLLAVHPPFASDIIVHTPQYVRKRLSMDDSFIRDILTKGRVLYEGNNARVDRQRRRGFHSSPTRTPRSKVPNL